MEEISKEETDSSTIPMTFRHSSVRSSISSWYRNYDIHFDILKLMGVLVVLLIMSATLTMTSNLYTSENSQNITDCIRLLTTDTHQQPNCSLCGYMKQQKVASYFHMLLA